MPTARRYCLYCGSELTPDNPRTQCDGCGDPGCEDCLDGQRTGLCLSCQDDEEADDAMDITEG